MPGELSSVDLSQLSVAAQVSGDPDGWPVLLLHGFPYDVHSYAKVAEGLVEHGARVVIPYLRGFGPTRFRSDATLRSGQQAAIGSDAAELIDALHLDRPILVGFDWGGRAACVAAALFPERVGGLVAIGGNEIQDIAGFAEPELPLIESRCWYQYYFHSERGRKGLARYRRELTAQLWREWEPGRPFDHAEFARTAPAFDNPDFVDVVVHSYRHRFGLAAGDPRYDQAEGQLAAQPTIDVPTIVLDPTNDPMVDPQSPDEHRRSFTRLIDHRLVETGHDTPRDDPDSVVRAVLDLWSGRIGQAAVGFERQT
jgi:pimeloyl-ACP methyl ester carboxylesterase